MDVDPVTEAQREPWRRRRGTHAALEGLSRRVLGDLTPRTDTWQLEAGRVGFGVTCDSGRMYIEAGDAVSAAHGLHRYLMQVARRRVCWDTPLPLDMATLPDGQLAGELPSPVAYYLNFCTFGYTAAAWDWDRWQREIDWMALHGITMPLAAVGHEAVLAEVYRAVGLSDEEILSFLGGPAYLPWQFMGCLDGWGTRMDRRWLEQRLQLGRQIVERELEYGMTPVLPSFVGHVPKALAGSDTTTREWWGFTTHLLDPRDERFGELSRSTVRTQAELLGTAHLYAADPFIEAAPPDDSPTFAADVGRSLVAGLRDGDPEAIWVMQAWTFDYLDWWTDTRVADFLDAVPDDAMLLLDLWGEHSPQWRRFGGFRGKPWIWCTLHNFGGRNDAFGAAEQSLAELHAAQRAGDPPLGIGLSMEATAQNPMNYELVLDRPAATELREWVADFARQRTETDDPQAVAAWERLRGSVYDMPSTRLGPTERPSAITLRPSTAVLDLEHIEQFAKDRASYPVAALAEACSDLLDLAADDPRRADGVLGHDLATLLATLTGRAADQLVVSLTRAWHSPARKIAGSASALLSLLEQLDELLAHRPELCLQTWEDAHALLGHTSTQTAGLRRDARLLVSVWNHAETHPLTDYSARLWSGLVSGLYRERWRVTISELEAAGVGQPTDAAFDRAIGEVTLRFLEHGWPPTRRRGTFIDTADRVLSLCNDVLDLPNRPRNTDK